MLVKIETDLKLKADMLKELYDFMTTFKCIFPESEVLGNLYVFRVVKRDKQGEVVNGKWKGKVNSIFREETIMDITNEN